MQHHITLNLQGELSAADWTKIAAIYASMDGWLPGGEVPAWFGHEGDERFIEASVEPAGIHFSAKLDAALWTGWLTVLCARLSVALGREVHDADM